MWDRLGFFVEVGVVRVLGLCVLMRFRGFFMMLLGRVVMMLYLVSGWV